MTSRVPAWMIVLIAVQLLLAGLFFLFGYSLSSSLGQGSTPAAADILVLALPAAVVAVLGAGAWTQWRAGRRPLAVALICVPLPLSFLLFLSLGMLY